MPVIESTSAVKTAEAEYDFAVDGGALGTITLRAAPGSVHGNTIPAGSVITHGYIDVDVATAGTGTVALTAESAGDIRAAATIASAGRINVVPVASGATSAKTTVARSITMTIGTAVVAQGRFRVVVFYK